MALNHELLLTVSMLVNVVVVASVTFQGWTIVPVAQLLWLKTERSANGPDLAWNILRPQPDRNDTRD